LLSETGTYASASLNLFLFSAGSGHPYSYKICGHGGEIQFIDNTTVRFTYSYTGGGDTCMFALIEL
jgi:hypothetical protein